VVAKSSRFSRRCKDGIKTAFLSPLSSPGINSRVQLCPSRHSHRCSPECGLCNLLRSNCLMPSGLRGLAVPCQLINPFCCCHFALM
jgi:hypothetical protein